MNGYELVRLQPKQVLKTGDTMTGNLTMQGNAKFVGNLQGNSDTTTRLATARNLTIGNTSRSFNGTTNIAWTLNDIGAAAINHTHAGGTVNMNGYVKPGVGGAISANDTINQAIGKLEYGLDNKAPLVHNQGAHTINLMTGYNKGNHNGAIAQGDSLNTAIAKLENGVNNKANANHTHSYLPLTGGTLTGDLTMRNSKINFTKAIFQTAINDNDTLEIIGTTDKNFGGLRLGTGGCRIYGSGNNATFNIEGGFYTNGNGRLAGDLVVDKSIHVEAEIKAVTEIWGKASSISFLPKKGTGFNGGVTIDWTGVQSPNAPTNQPRYEIKPSIGLDARLGSNTAPFHSVYGQNSYVTTSDRNAKENIKYINNSPVTTININNDIDEGFLTKDLSKEDFYNFFKDEIEFATYDFKQGNIENLETNIGFIAQDIAETKVGSKIVIPPIEKVLIPQEDGTVIEKDNENPMYSYSTGNFNSAMGIALQCAIEKIELLEKEIEALKAQP